MEAVVVVLTSAKGFLYVCKEDNFNLTKLSSLQIDKIYL